MDPQKLVMMANQIAAFFATQPGGNGAAEVAGHLRKFWDPRMRAEILAYSEAGGLGLSPTAAAAVRALSVH